MSQRDLRKMGTHVNGIPVRLLFPASVVYTRPSHLMVEGVHHLPGGKGVLPLYLEDQVRSEFPDATIEVVREEYAVAERARR